MAPGFPPGFRLIRLFKARHGFGEGVLCGAFIGIYLLLAAYVVTHP